MRQQQDSQQHAPGWTELTGGTQLRRGVGYL